MAAPCVVDADRGEGEVLAALTRYGWRRAPESPCLYISGDDRFMLCLTPAPSPLCAALTPWQFPVDAPPVYLARDVDAAHPGGTGAGVYLKNWVSGVLAAPGRGAVAAIIAAAQAPARTLDAAVAAARHLTTGTAAPAE